MDRAPSRRRLWKPSCDLSCAPCQCQPCVVLRRAVLRYVSRAFSAATLGLGASFMVVPHGRYVAGAPRSLEAVGGLGTRRFQRHLSRRLSRAHARSSTGSVTPSLASA